MGWFDEQLREREQLDNEVLSEAFLELYDAVRGTHSFVQEMNLNKTVWRALNELATYFRVKVPETSERSTSLESQLEHMFAPAGIMWRSVTLESRWYKKAIGAMLAFEEETGNAVVLIPKRMGGYKCLDMETGHYEKVTRERAEALRKEVLVFYKPFPPKPLTKRDFLKAVLRSIQLSDFLAIGACATIAVLLGSALPLTQQVLFTYVIPAQDIQVLTIFFIAMICLVIAQFIFTMMRRMYLSRISLTLGLWTQSATMMRILSLPSSFFKEYNPGELFARLQAMTTLANIMVTILFTSSLAIIVSLVYVAQFPLFAPSFFLAAIVFVLLMIGVTALAFALQVRVEKKTFDLEARESGMVYAMFQGIQKIRLTGSEKRSFARWAKLYAQKIRIRTHPHWLLQIYQTLLTALLLIATIYFYVQASATGMPAADFYAFTTAFTFVAATIIEEAPHIMLGARAVPIFSFAEPIFEAEPEVSEEKSLVERLSGSIELNHVSFRYSESMPLVIDDLSIKIRSGEYIALVGESGCGKSTLMRLLLGFESPTKGAIYYDGRDLQSLDLHSLRRHIGIVMQDGHLFSGDLFSNIAINNPHLTVSEAWDIAQKVGIAEDIKRMPMGMSTVVSEGGGGISGGQRQRIMIARALAMNPRLIILDEATSALDNISQRIVAETLDELHCTRIIIAHRLSTIRHCKRILFIEDGHIIEDGSYEELIARGGRFAGLVERQVFQ